MVGYLSGSTPPGVLNCEILQGCFDCTDWDALIDANDSINQQFDISISAPIGVYISKERAKSEQQNRPNSDHRNIEWQLVVTAFINVVNNSSKR